MIEFPDIHLHCDNGFEALSLCVINSVAKPIGDLPAVLPESFTWSFANLAE
jgi:hypothetical protein